MNSILVPVDFSSTSDNAALYAAKMATQMNVPKIVLYHSYIADNVGSHLSDEELQKQSQIILDKLVQKMQSLNADIEYISITNGGLIFENIQILLKEYEAHLIVMGITGKNKLEQKLIGSNTIKIAQMSGVPVLIIPPHCSFSKIEKITMALPLRENLIEFIPHEEINKLVKRLDAMLLVVNVEKKDDITPTRIVYAGLQAAHFMFDEVNATFHLIQDQNIAQGIADYATDNDSQLVISVAEEHSFLQFIFKGSITTQLAFYTKIPLLVYKPSND